MKKGLVESRLDLPTSWGTIRVKARQGRLVECCLPRVDRLPAQPLRLRGRPALRVAAVDRRVLKQALLYVRACLSGRPGRCPPLADPASKPFTRRVREILRSTQPGSTCTYQELARGAGAPGAARAAGSACARNPLPLFIPCHRVLAAGGRLGGFSAGLAWKATLLEREQAGRRGGRS